MEMIVYVGTVLHLKLKPFVTYFFFSVFLQELFVQDLARMCLVKSANKNSVDYNDLANIVDQQETLAFLQGSYNSISVLSTMVV